MKSTVHCLRMKKEQLMMIDLMILAIEYAFKRKTLSCVNSAHEEQQLSRHSSRSSSRQSSIDSNRSSETKGFRSPKSFKEKELEGRVKMAELLAEAQYVEQKQQIENQAEMLNNKQEIAKIKARVEAYDWKETICELATDSKILAPMLKTTDKKEKLYLSERLINQYNTKSGNSLSNACVYNTEAPPIRKDSSKLMKINKRSAIKDERRKDKE